MQPLAVPESLGSSAAPVGSAVLVKDDEPPRLHVPKPRRPAQADPVQQLASPQHAPSLPPAHGASLPAPAPLPSPPRVETPEGGAWPQCRLQPGDLVQGAQVEYYSESNRCWMPAVVVFVDAESGGVKINVKPNQVLPLQEQQQRLRPRTRPRKHQLEWVRRTLREGRLEEEAQEVFQKHAKPGPRPDSSLVLRAEDLHAVGADLDAKLGISGSACALKHVAAQVESRFLVAESFGEVFWELLWGVQKDFCQALPGQRGNQRRPERPEDVYTFERTLGQGTFGTVRLARSKATGAERAVKQISKRDHLWGSAEQLEVEIEHLCLLDHPHIVRLYEHYEDTSHIYLVMDFCSGGELMGMITESKLAGRYLPELFAADVMRQVLLAIAHVHARGVIHLDLKSTNIMLMPSKRTLPPGRAVEGYTLAHITEKPHVMVIDLGVAQIFRPGNFKFNRPMGTPATMAPEVWTGEIHPKADVFSCGVVLFELLGLCFPFSCPVDLIEAVRYWNSAPVAPWASLQHSSEFAVGLCKRMLMLDRRDRPTASQCLQAPFIVQSASALRTVAPTVTTAAPHPLLQRLLSVAERSMLHRSVALSLARAWPANQLPSIKRFFHELDTQRSGRLGLDHLEAALERLGAERTHAKEAAAAMDLSRDGTVCWTEFVAACIDLSSGNYEKELQQIFDEADADKDGLLSQQDIAKLLLADHLREDQAVRDAFADLVGRRDPGARVDWPTFRQHFQREAAVKGGGAADVVGIPAQDPVARDADAPAGPVVAEDAPQQVGFFEQARGLVEWARDAVWPEQRSDPGEPAEDDLRQLADMGFSDRERCVAVLRKHHNRLSYLVLDELVESDEVHL